MSKLQQKVSYLKGLAEGLGVEKSSREGRLLTEIIAVLSEITNELDGVNEAQQDLQEYISALDESVGELEDDYWGWDEDEDDFEDDDFVELECPECHGKVYFEEDALDDESIGQISCPECGEIVLSFGEPTCDSDLKINIPAED
ncbi:MAG: CD1247 N-terminal domain-containing protein [bacterium]